MLELKKGDYVRISKAVLVRRKSGKIECFIGRIGRVVDVGFKKCRCDIGGLEKQISIPKTHLERVA